MSGRAASRTAARWLRRTGAPRSRLTSFVSVTRPRTSCVGTTTGAAAPLRTTSRRSYRRGRGPTS
eukprot:9347743-Lingulodinium_polyedra.AAC.1